MGKKKPYEVTPENVTREKLDALILRSRKQLLKPGVFNTACNEPINFTLKTRLLVTPSQAEFLDGWIDEGRLLQNALVNIVNNKIHEIEETPRFMELKALVTEKDDPEIELTKEEIKAKKLAKREANKEMKQMYKDAGLYDLAIRVLGAQVAKRLDLSPYTPAITQQFISDKVYSALDKFLYSNGRELHRKGKDFVNSIGYTDVADWRFDPISGEGSFLVGAKRVAPRSTKEPTGKIKPPTYTDDVIQYQLNAAEHSIFRQQYSRPELMYLKMDIDNNPHATKCLLQCLATSEELSARKQAEKEQKAEADRIKAEGGKPQKNKKEYIRMTSAKIIREGVGKKKRYFICISIYGYIPNKFDQFGELKHVITEKGLQGIHIDKTGLYSCNGGKLRYHDISGNINNDDFAKKSVKYSRIMSEIRAKDNPDNFESNGVTKKGEMKWYESPEYKLAKSRHNRLNEKRKNIRKETHYFIANKLLEFGDTAIAMKTDYVDDMKKVPYSYSPERDEYKKFVMDCAPASMLTTLEWKLKQHGRSSLEVFEKDLAVLSYNHATDTFNEDLKGESFITVDGHKLYHGAYVAFLLSHIKGGKTKGEMTKKQERINASKGIETEYEKPYFDKKALAQDFPEFLRTYHNIELQLGHPLM